tara:strand:+ start:399 stop:548 length:150 start_codon:yes stop_codon:yes gene_type:complete
MIKRINPIARAMAYMKQRKQIVKAKKGKGSYVRTKEKKRSILEISKEKE